MSNTTQKYAGGMENGSGYSYDVNGSDGTIQTVYVPSSRVIETVSSINRTPEPRSTLRNRIVTDGSVIGRMIGTECAGTVAKIRDRATGRIYKVDASTVSRYVAQ